MTVSKQLLQRLCELLAERGLPGWHVQYARADSGWISSYPRGTRRIPLGEAASLTIWFDKTVYVYHAGRGCRIAGEADLPNVADRIVETMKGIYASH